MPALADRILAALPQTQCTRCGYPDCAAYAQAIAERQAGINQCPPGGVQGIARLAAITGQALLPLNPVNGLETPRAVAIIDEAWCIGCTLCIKACPTDAIVGSNKLMHTVIESYCTGCELCIPVCPVDCIALVNVTATATGWDAWSADLAAQARQRYAASRARRHSGQMAVPHAPHAPAADVGAHEPSVAAQAAPSALPNKRAIIAAAQAKARTLRQR